jgi:cytochrome c2
MPVPTETFRSIRKLNIIFAASAVFLLLITLWLIMDDWYRPWRAYQQDARQWQAVLTADTLDQTATAQLNLELAQKEEEIRRLRDAWPKERLALLERDLAAMEKLRIQQDLPTAIAKSSIVPTEQQIERARLQYGEDAPETNKLREKLKTIKDDYLKKSKEMEALIVEIGKKTAEIAAFRKAEEEQKKDLENLDRERRALADKLAKLQPGGLGLVGEKARNAPLLDWFNPSEKIQQVIVPGVRTDLNFLTVETADACQTCHTNIDRPEFEEGELVRFLQRQVARTQNQDVNTIDDAVVDIDFWENAVERLAVTGGDATVRGSHLKIVRDTLVRINAKRDEAADPTLKPIKFIEDGKEKDPAAWTATEAKQWRDTLAAELRRIGETAGNANVGRRLWYEQRLLYVEDLQNLIKRQVGEKEFNLLRRYFRHKLVDQFNAARGGKAVSNSPVMLAHPRLDLYLDPESPHPLKSMGCSVCHEGSGQETSFFHVAHQPRNIWVDAETGATIPAFLLTTGPSDRGTEADLRARLRELPKAPEASPGKSGKDLLVSTGSLVLASKTDGEAHPGESTKPHAAHADHAALSNEDVNLLSPGRPAPYSPAEQDHLPARLYTDPTSNQPRVAVRQATYWEKTYHWHAVHAVDWEKPMHAMEYVESSCTKCHTGHYDLRNEAKKVYEGRKLFAQVGCANCHLVDQIADHKDIKKVGPSLAHVKDKLSPAMLATWIWSPKAFRPTSRMPHFFMLENNSTPVDILRTRTETAAIAHYLLSAPPASLEKIALLMQEDGRLVAERGEKATLGSRQFEIDKRRTAIAAEVAAIKQSGITRYQPELPPVQAKLQALADEKEKIAAKLKDAATKAEEKPALEARLAAIDGEAKTAKEKPLVGDAKRGRELFMGVPGATIADGGVGCAACHTNLNEGGDQWVLADLVNRFDYGLDNSFHLTLMDAQQKLDMTAASRLAAEMAQRAVDKAPSIAQVGKKDRDEAIVALAHELATNLVEGAKKISKPAEPDAKAKPEDERQRLRKETERRTLEALTVADGILKGLREAVAKAVFPMLTYNQKHSYVLQYLPAKLNRRGPELSGVGTKLKAGRTEEQAQAWVYDWVRNPRHYSSYTIMPSFRLSEQEALDLTAYLLQQERPGDNGSTWTPVDFIAETKGDLNAMMVDALAKKLGVAEALDANAKLLLVGKKLVMHYNCQACHLINGFEDTLSSAPQLNDWGLKDAHKLDFGYFEHAESRRRREPATVWKVDHEGLGADAAKITHESDRGGDPKIEPRQVAWEEIDEYRRPWATFKLHNTRIYDRGRYVVPDMVAELDVATWKKANQGTKNAAREIMDVGIDKAYDKLKMPKFFLTDDDAQAIITFVTSIRKPLVEPALQKVADDAGKRATIGRQIAEKYNCYGCHNIEANKVAIHAFYDVFDEHGQFNGNFERLMNAPPRLIGQGAKTQPDWVAHFLGNVHPLRPWLKVRMPSFNFHDDDALRIADYFAGATQKDADRIARILAPIDAQLGKNSARKKDLDIENAKIAERLAASEKADAKGKMSAGSVKALTGRQAQIATQKTALDRWSEQPALAKAVERLKAFALRNDLAQPRTFDARQTTSDERATTFDGVLYASRFLHDVYQVQYPYPPLRLPDISEERFARGEALFNQVLCAKCHALGDETKLLAIWKKDNPNAGAPAAPKKPDDDYDDAPKTPAPKPDATKPAPGKPPAAAGGDEDYDETPKTAVAPPATGPAWSAPNLRYAVHRIQPQWAEKWIQRSLIILPGTKMPNQWAGPSPLDSFFFQFPDEAKLEAHRKFYYTGPEQRQLILDYIYAAGMRNYTPGLWKLEGKPEPVLALSPVEPPKADEFKLPEIVDTSKPATPTTPTGPVVSVAEKAKSDIALHEGEAKYEGDAVQGNKTRLVGVIKFVGTKVGRKPIEMSSDPFCAKQHDEQALTDNMVVNADGTMRFAFVQIKSVPGKFELPKTPALIDQKGCIYYPHVVGVMAGQTLNVKNSDGTLHNVHIMPKKNPEVNIGQPAKDMVSGVVFKNVEENVFVKCDVHAWMNARVHVVPHPFFSVSDVEGRFEIRGLPPGKYTLEVIHELPATPRMSVEVEVKADTSTRLDVTVK